MKSISSCRALEVCSEGTDKLANLCLLTHSLFSCLMAAVVARPRERNDRLKGAKADARRGDH